MRFKLALYWIVICLITMFALNVQATEDFKDVCAHDADQFCKNIERKNGKMMQCLYRNKQSLSADCLTKVEKVRSNVHARREECRPDAEKFCQGIEHGDGRINECLKSHLAELTETCRKNVLATGRKHKSVE